MFIIVIMPISDRLDKENVAHIHHGILCSHKKGWVHILCRDVDEAGSHHSQQTNTGTENQTPHVLTQKKQDDKLADCYISNYNNYEWTKFSNLTKHCQIVFWKKNKQLEFVKRDIF